MKDNKVQIALLSVIAIALVALAVSQFTGGSSTTESSIVAAPANAPANVEATKAFDPLAQANQAEPLDNTPKTTVTFGQYEHDFGNIMQDSDNKYKFTFTNTGSEPLIIESASGSCGCTVPEYPKAPIPPGSTGEIVVEYKPGKQENAQNKTVTVVANTEPKQTTLRIKANVQKVG